MPTTLSLWLGDPLLVGGLVAIIGAAAALAVGILQFVGAREAAVLERLARGAGGIPIDLSSASRSRARLSAGARLLQLLARVAQPAEGKELSRIRTRLDHAGLRGPRAVELLFGAKLALALVLAGGFVALVALGGRKVASETSVTVVLAAVGFYAPNVWLSGRIGERQKQLSRALPDTLDLMVTCVEAGLGIEAAIARVVEEIGLGAPLLARELRQLTVEVRAGISRGEAFRRLAARTGLDELRALSATLVQTELFGTSVGRALRLQSEGMRIKRSQRAEERAATVATKMLVPLILCILPSLFAVIMGPAVVRIVHSLLPSLGGAK